jgi:hypothetical protein
MGWSLPWLWFGCSFPYTQRAWSPAVKCCLLGSSKDETVRKIYEAKSVRVTVQVQVVCTKRISVVVETKRCFGDQTDSDKYGLGFIHDRYNSKPATKGLRSQVTSTLSVLLTCSNCGDTPKWLRVHFAIISMYFTPSFSELPICVRSRSLHLETWLSSIWYWNYFV